MRKERRLRGGWSARNWQESIDVRPRGDVGKVRRRDVLDATACLCVLSFAMLADLFYKLFSPSPFCGEARDSTEWAKR